MFNNIIAEIADTYYFKNRGQRLLFVGTYNVPKVKIFIFNKKKKNL